jgi:hypothetical protein
MGETRQPNSRATAWLQAHLAGATFAEIARAEGLHRSRIHYLVARHPDYVHDPAQVRPRRDAAFIEAVRCLRDEGLSMSQVGERLGVSKNTIVGVCTRHLR